MRWNSVAKQPYEEEPRLTRLLGSEMEPKPCSPEDSVERKLPHDSVDVNSKPVNSFNIISRQMSEEMDQMTAALNRVVGREPSQRGVRTAPENATAVKLTSKHRGDIRPLNRWCGSFVMSDVFAMLVGAMIFLNAVFIFVQTDSIARNPGGQTHAFY